MDLLSFVDLDGSNYGFTRTLSCALISGDAKSVLKGVRDAKKQGKLSVVRVTDEKQLRFAIERSGCDVVLGAEMIHPKESVHFPRSGVDQVICSLARSKGVALGFSFEDILVSKHRSRLLRRIAFNARLCYKYKTPVVFSVFSSSQSSLRSAHDLLAFWRILGGRNDLALSFRR